MHANKLIKKEFSLTYCWVLYLLCVFLWLPSHFISLLSFLWLPSHFGSDQGEEVDLSRLRCTNLPPYTYYSDIIKHKLDALMDAERKEALLSPVIWLICYIYRWFGTQRGRSRSSPEIISGQRPSVQAHFRASSLLSAVVLISTHFAITVMDTEAKKGKQKEEVRLAAVGQLSQLHVNATGAANPRGSFVYHVCPADPTKTNQAMKLFTSLTKEKKEKTDKKKDVEAGLLDFLREHTLWR